MTDNELRLLSPKQALPEIAKIFAHALRNGNGECEMVCNDEGAFVENKSVNLGTVKLAASGASESKSHAKMTIAELIRFGAFEWMTADAKDIETELLQALDIRNNSEPQDLDRLLNAVGSIGARTGLIQPVFDPESLSEMPYSHSTTVVADTSGVLQGGLNFVSRFLHPPTRIKIPSIVHMEIIESTNNYLRLRRLRNKKRRKSEFAQHLQSQGGSRVLTRLELQGDTEVERTFLLGDPLRDAFSTDNDKELSGLNISIPVRSYVDRLILEAARRHQAQSEPSHRVRLLTCDGGLARMALAEGMMPLYFESAKNERFFGNRLTGRMLNPFHGNVIEHSLADILWEFSAAFGAAKIISKDGKSEFAVKALGKELAWSPYHSLDDLLWCSTTIDANSDRLRPTTKSPPMAVQSQKPVKTDSGTSGEREKRNGKVVFRRFSVGQMIRLICQLDDSQEMLDEEVVNFLQVQKSAMGEYRRFLVSAGFVKIENDMWKCQMELRQLSAAIRNQRLEEMHTLLRSEPSYDRFASAIERLLVGNALDPSLLGLGTLTYRTLGEITGMCTEIKGKGIYSTPNRPEAREFAEIALKRFREMNEGEELVSTGAWLESLIMKNGVHPEISKARLNQASEQGILHRSTEGSTMQIRNSDHVLHVLSVDSEGRAHIEKVHLYRGDYLIAGKASVSLRIREANL